MIIKILNKNNFNQLMVDHKIDCGNLKDQKDTYIISINDSRGSMSTSYFQNCKSDNLLVLHFDDSDKNYKMKLKNSANEFFHLQVMTDVQGKEIISFMESIKDNITDKTQLIVHCTAGQNRSGSVGKFAVDFFEYDMKRFFRDNPIVKGNSVVTSTLNRLWLWGHYDQ